MAKQKDDTTEKISKQNSLNAALKQQQEILGKISSAESESLETYADRLNLQEQLYKNAKLIAAVSEKIDQFSQSESDRAKILTEQYTGHRDLLEEVQSKYSELVLNSKNIVEDSFEVVDLTKEQNKLAELLLETDLAREVLGEKEYTKQKELLEFIKQRLDSMGEINNSQERANELAKKFLSETSLINKTFDGISSLANKFGGDGIIGKFLGEKASGLIDTAKDDIKNKIVTAFQQSGEAGVTAFEVTKMAAGSFMQYALPALGIAGLLGIFYGMIKAATHLDEELKEVGHEFLVGRKEAEQIHFISKGIAKEMKIVGINSAEVADGIRETEGIMNGLSIVSLMKQGNDEAKKLVENTTLLTEKFGLSGDEVSAIQNLSVLTKKPIGEIVKDATKMGKGLLTSRASLQLIAKLSPGMVLNFKKGGQELLKAAQKAKLLGMELSDVESFGESLLDIEGSLEKEMEARVLTGKNINMDRARELMLNNDIAGLQEEMLKSMGSLAEFEKMSYLQRKSIASLYNMEIDQVAKVLMNQEKLNELGIDQVKLSDLQAKNAEELRKESERMGAGKLKDYVTQLAKEKEVATINERIADSIKKIKEMLAGTLAPLLEQAHAFLDSAEGAEFIKGTVDGIKTIMTSLVSVIKAIGTGIAYVNKLFGGTGVALGIVGGLLATIATYFIGKALIIKGVQSLIGSLGSASNATATLANNMQNVANASNAAGGAAGNAGGIGGIVSGLTPFAQNMLAISVGIIAFAGAMWISAKAFQEFGKVNWDQAKYGGVVMLGLMAGISVMAYAALALVTTGADAALKLVALSVVAFAAALYGSAQAFKVMGEVNWKGFDGMFTALTKVVTSFSMIGLASIAIMAGAVALSAAGIAVGIFAGSVWLLSKGLKGLTEIGDLKSAGMNLAEGMKEMGKIPGMIDIDALEDSFDELEDALDELNFGDLVKLGELAKSDLSKAGANIKAGLESLIGIEKDLNLGRTGWFFGYGGGKTGIVASLSSLDDAIGQLDLDGVKSFVEIAKTNFKNVGKNINVGIESLREVQVGPDVKKNLLAVENIFDWFEDALRELDYEQLTQFMSVEWNKMQSFPTMFNEFLNKLQGMPSNTEDILDSFEANMKVLNTSINKIDTGTIDKLNKLSISGGIRFAKEFTDFIKQLQSVKNTRATLAKFKEDMELLNEASNAVNSNAVTNANANMSSGLSQKIQGLWEWFKEGAKQTLGMTTKTTAQTATVVTNTTSGVNSSVGGRTSSDYYESTNKKLDQVISLLSSISNSANQPMVIKVGDRTIESIGQKLQLTKDYTLATNADGRINKFG